MHTWNDSRLSNLNLTSWQESQLKGLTSSGIDCLISNWISLAENPIKEPHCNATWDDIYCWPPTLAGTNISRPCADVMKDDYGDEAANIIGDAFRVCTNDATWLWGEWTNYNVCMQALETLEDTGNITVNPPSEAFPFKVIIRYILFVGSILSLICLGSAIFIFRYFKSLQCDRITIHAHMMTALMLKSILLIIITEPTIFHKNYSYRSVEWVCKSIIALQIYAAVAAINWMFVQGHYLNSKLTTNVWKKKFPIGIYLFVGWGFPLILVGVWSTLMECFHEAICWHKYGKLPYIWILVTPVLLALVVNMILLINILRVLLTKIQLSNVTREREQFRRAVKATAFLFPLLGLNNLLFFYNPGGTGERYYMLLNALLQSSQGIAVAVLYCFCCKDVQDAIRREYGRFSAQQEVSSDKLPFRRSTMSTKYRLTNNSYKSRKSEHTEAIMCSQPDDKLNHSSGNDQQDSCI